MYNVYYIFFWYEQNSAFPKSQFQMIVKGNGPDVNQGEVWKIWVER